MRKVITFFATGAYVGYSPIAPGTAGTLLGIPVFLLFCSLNVHLYTITLLTMSVLACLVSEHAERILGQKDSPRIVIDEIIGYLVAMFQCPPTARDILFGFLLFRFFDIAKPFPIRLIQSRLPGGYGVVLDDVMAGIYANVSRRMILYFWYSL